MIRAVGVAIAQQFVLFWIQLSMGSTVAAPGGQALPELQSVMVLMQVVGVLTVVRWAWLRLDDRKLQTPQIRAEFRRVGSAQWVRRAPEVAVDGYPRYHQSRPTCYCIIVVVPLFLAGNVALVVGLVGGSFLEAGLGAMAMVASAALQDRASHGACPSRAVHQPLERRGPPLPRAVDQLPEVRPLREVAACLCQSTARAR